MGSFQLGGRQLQGRQRRRHTAGPAPVSCLNGTRTRATETGIFREAYGTIKSKAEREYTHRQKTFCAQRWPLISQCHGHYSQL